MTRTVLAVIGPTLAGVGLVASLCAPARPVRHVVEMRGFAFQPAVLAVAPGDTIEWVNLDALPHTATAASGGWDSGRMDARARWSLVPTETGSFEYVCAYHPTMRGTLEVSGAVR